MQVKGIFKKPKQEQPDLLGDIVSIHKLAEDLKDIKSTTEQTILESKKVSQETQNISDQKIREIDNKVEEFTQIASELIDHIHNLHQIQGKDGVPADEAKITQTLLSKIPTAEQVASKMPKLDKNALINEVVAQIPKADLKIIKETFAVDPNTIVSHILSLPSTEFQLTTAHIKDLDLTIRLLQNQSGTGGKPYIHGGGFNNIYNASSLVSNGLTGLNFTGSGVASVTKNATTGIITVDISGGGGGSVTSVTGTSPIVIDNTDPTQPIVTIQVANTSQSGYLSSTDWNTFNNKQPAGTYVTSVPGTANRITSSGGTTPAIDISASYVGQTSITTLGTISTGVWGGTVISLASGGTGSNLNDPGANKILAWDDTDNTIGFWAIGSGLSYDHTTHTLSASGGGGTVTDFIFTDANGFDGTVTLSTSTPTLSLTTTVADTRVMFSNSGAITGGADMTFAGSRLTVTDLTVTNTIVGSISGNAATVTTNANLTGPITSSGNATAIANSINLPASPTTTTQSPADNSTKIATTAYVDNAVLGQNFKEAVNYASTAPLPTVVYANGSSGVGATLTGFAFGALSLDGSAPIVGNRVLIKNQVSTFQNGIYIVTATGSGAAVFVMTRTTDADQATDWKTGDSVFVVSGNTLSTTTWAYTGVDSPTMGTDAITWAQTAGQGSFTAGNGISITGVSIAIDTSVTVDKTTSQVLTNKSLTSPLITNLTAGRVTFAGTSGLLTDDADFTFATDTLTVTKIATTQFTGNITLSTVNIITDTSTGTKIGTATNQKLGFFNSTPIVQPTGDVITALQNLGLGASLTVLATTITSRTLWGQTYDGSGNVSGSLTAVTDITGGASNMVITSGTGNSRTLTLRTTTSGGVATAAITIDDAQKATFGGHLVVEGVTSTGATGTGKFVFDTAPVFATSITTPSVLATANDSGALGASGTAFSDLFLASGAVINFVAGDYTLTHSSGILTANKDLRITTAGSDATSVLTQGSTNTITSKTLTSSTNVLGGVTMTLGSDADGDIYYRASNVLTRLAKGTSSQVLIGGTVPSWGTAPSTFPWQVLSLFTGTDTITILNFTSNPTGTVMFVAMITSSSTTTVQIYRLAKDSLTGNYYITHKTTLTVSASGLGGIAVVGTKLYVSCTISAAIALRRYDVADLANVTTVTFSGTARSSTCFSDGTDLYIGSGTSTADRFTIATTVATNQGAVTYTGAKFNGNFQPICDGTSVWATDSTSSSLLAAGTYKINKYALAGGAASSSLTLNMFADAYTGLTNAAQLFMATSTQLGIAYGYNTVSAAAVTGILANVMAITLP